MQYQAGNKLMNQTNKQHKKYKEKKTFKLGSLKKPAKIQVNSEARLKEFSELAKKNGWLIDIELNENLPQENISDLNILLNTPKPISTEQKTGRNDLCPCNSEKKYKKCCGK